MIKYCILMTTNPDLKKGTSELYAYIKDGWWVDTKIVFGNKNVYDVNDLKLFDTRSQASKFIDDIKCRYAMPYGIEIK